MLLHAYHPRECKDMQLASMAIPQPRGAILSARLLYSVVAHLEEALHHFRLTCSCIIALLQHLSCAFHVHNMTCT